MAPNTRVNTHAAATTATDSHLQTMTIIAHLSRSKKIKAPSDDTPIDSEDKLLFSGLRQALAEVLILIGQGWLALRSSSGKPAYEIDRRA